MYHHSDIITAPATASGGALSVVRLSGEGCIALCDTLFRGRHTLSEAPTHTLHYGSIEADGEWIDEVVISLFRAPHSYTGEESVEISCHGSRYITRRLLEVLIERGARMATAGEFTQRAFLNGRMDLSQAEAVGDLIAAESRAAHRLATHQMRGDYSHSLEAMQAELLRLCSLVELELDFSEEDVTFADREELEQHIRQLKGRIEQLQRSFQLGNALKEGITVAIVGEPNVGKSTLLNRLTGEDRAMVSEIAGTTRDTIEEMIRIDDLLFRFVDTAGLHTTEDRLEQMGIERTRHAITRAQIVLQLLDANRPQAPAVEVRPEQQLLQVVNKSDTLSNRPEELASDRLYLSAKTGEGVEQLLHRLREMIDTSALDRGDTIISTARHVEALRLASESLDNSLRALHDELPGDLLAEELRQVAHHLSTITGAITSDRILQSIFRDFCIGK